MPIADVLAFKRAHLRERRTNWCLIAIRKRWPPVGLRSTIS